MTSADAIAAVACPACKSPAGEPCRSLARRAAMMRGPRTVEMHRARLRLAEVTLPNAVRRAELADVELALRAALPHHKATP